MPYSNEPLLKAIKTYMAEVEEKPFFCSPVLERASLVHLDFSGREEPEAYRTYLGLLNGVRTCLNWIVHD